VKYTTALVHFVKAALQSEGIVIVKDRGNERNDSKKKERKKREREKKTN
jgi:hypothetical protein